MRKLIGIQDREWWLKTITADATEEIGTDLWSQDKQAWAEQAYHHYLTLANREENPYFLYWLEQRVYFPFCDCVGCQMGFGSQGMFHQHESAFSLLLTFIKSEVNLIIHNLDDFDFDFLKEFTFFSFFTHQPTDERN